MRRNLNPVVTLIVGCLLMAACGGSGGSDPGEEAGDSRVTIEWFVGLGTGGQPEQFAAQEDVVERFNSSQDDIKVELTIYDPDLAYDEFRRRIDAGDPPDIVGPIGIRGANEFSDEFLDLSPFIDEETLADYDPEQVAVFEEDGKLTALPFGVFPSMMFYNRDVFDQAGLPYPPTEFGEEYQGEPWTIDAMTRLAEQLTIDSNGRNVADPDFDRDQVIQWGFNPQWLADPRAHGTLFGAGSLVAPDGTAQVPEHWLAEWEWLRGNVERGVSPNRTEIESALLGEDNAFGSGRVAMAFTHLWYASSIVDENEKELDFWDLAAVPAYEGEVTSKLHADTFRVVASTNHAEEATTVLRYLHGEAAPDLLTAYSSFPARVDQQPAFLDDLAQRFPRVQNWSVINESLTKPDVPSHESLLPGMPESQDVLDDFEEALRGEAEFDLEASVDDLLGDLDEAFGSP